MKQLVKITDFPQVVAIVGSRKFKKKERVSNLINQLTQGTIVVSGGARNGVDLFVKQVVFDCPNVFYKEFTVTDFEWNTFGKRAGMLRNEDLVQYVKRRNGLVIVMLSEVGMTPGSKNVLDLCKQHKVECIKMTERKPSNVTMPCSYCDGTGCPYCNVYGDHEVGWRPA